VYERESRDDVSHGCVSRCLRVNGWRVRWLRVHKRLREAYRLFPFWQGSVGSGDHSSSPARRSFAPLHLRHHHHHSSSPFFTDSPNQRQLQKLSNTRHTEPILDMGLISLPKPNCTQSVSTRSAEWTTPSWRAGTGLGRLVRSILCAFASSK
jgi:hypothetical protein